MVQTTNCLIHETLKHRISRKYAFFSVTNWLLFRVGSLLKALVYIFNKNVISLVSVLIVGNLSLVFKFLYLVFPENIFTQQPSYYSDLEETIPTVLQVRSAF